MNITTAEFIKGIRGTDKILEENKPQIAFVGRSNVGKSSVINSLCGRKNLVKSSSTPGKTKEINFFLIDKKVYFVDLPGYGYAKVRDKNREKIIKMIIWYLTEAPVKELLVVLIIDAKVGPTEFDFEMLRLLRDHRQKFIIIANKVDKLNKSEAKKQMNSIDKELTGEDIILPYSARTGEGKKELLGKIFG